MLVHRRYMMAEYDSTGTTVAATVKVHLQPRNVSLMPLDLPLDLKVSD